jgi:23S rRNA (cytosine1962-C5)-methyltransferase
MNLLDAFAQAYDRRCQLHGRSDQTAYRIFHGYAEGHLGLTVDRWADTALISHKNNLGDQLEPLATALSTRYAFTNVISKTYDDNNWNPRATAVSALHGNLPSAPIQVRDNGLCFLAAVNTLDAHGLFLDARPARAWLLKNSQNRRILNLFSYTGSLGIAAAKGGARSVVHVDNKASPHKMARENHRLNDLAVDERAFLKGNVYQHLPRALRAGAIFEGIILDPPPRVPNSMAHRPPRGQDFAQLASLAAPLLATGGWLLCFFSRYDRVRAACEKDVLENAGVPLSVLWRGESGEDFPEAEPERKLRLTAFVRQQGDIPQTNG